MQHRPGKPLFRMQLRGEAACRAGETKEKAGVASGLYLATDSEQNILVIDKEKAAKCGH